MKKRILLLGTLLISPALMAKPEINLQALEACSMIENDFNRLLCYDKVMAGKSPSQGKHKAKGMPEHAKERKQAAQNKSRADKQPEFGLEHKEQVREQAREIELVIAQVKNAPHGELILTMKNGQIWRQVGSDRFRVKPGDKVMISRGMFNSFLLKLAGSSRTIRVKRTD